MSEFSGGGLARIIRSKLNDGTLPREDPLWLATSVGSGNPCSACEQPIVPLDTEYQPHYDRERATVRLHIGCHRLWQAERNRRR